MTDQADAHGLETARRLRGARVRRRRRAGRDVPPPGADADRAVVGRRGAGRSAARARRRPGRGGSVPQSIDTVTLRPHGRGGGRRSVSCAGARGSRCSPVARSSPRSLSAELLKAVLPRPSYGTEIAILASKDYDTYPSGHATIATGFVLALVMVNNNRWRPLVALLGLLWSSAVATGVVAAGWHRPSDAIGGIALATAWLSLSAAFLSRERGLAAEPGRLARALPALAATLADPRRRHRRGPRPHQQPGAPARRRRLVGLPDRPDHHRPHRHRRRRHLRLAPQRPPLRRPHPEIRGSRRHGHAPRRRLTQIRHPSTHPDDSEPPTTGEGRAKRRPPPEHRHGAQGSPPKRSGREGEAWPRRRRSRGHRALAAAPPNARVIRRWDGAAKAAKRRRPRRDERQRGAWSGKDTQCGRRDLNPHAREHRNLNPACLPVPPLPRNAAQPRRGPPVHP